MVGGYVGFAARVVVVGVAVGVRRLRVGVRGFGRARGSFVVDVVLS